MTLARLMEEDERIARIEEVVAPVLGDHGLTLVDLEWRPHRPRGVLRVFVDRPGGVAVGDCERLSRELGDILDAAALIEGAYDLEVSSPGLDRELRKDRELRWALGRPVRCWLAGGQELAGRLGDVQPERLVIEAPGSVVEVERAHVTKLRLEPEVPWSRRARRG